MYLSKQFLTTSSLLITFIINTMVCQSHDKNKTLTLLPVKSGERGWAGGPLNKDFLKMICNNFEASLFVETGTYLGESSEIAADIFEQVHTIELSFNLYLRACVRFKNNQSILLYCGDSANVLKQILPSLQKKSVLWLDGHWSRGETARGTINTPIIEELLALQISKIKNHIILIDDIRFFQRANRTIEDSALEDYPDLCQVIDIIHRTSTDYVCWVYGDILIAYQDSNLSVAPIIQAMTISRLNNAEENLLLEAEKIIINASEAEIAFIKELSDDFADDGGYGFNRYYHFWRALTLLNRDVTLARYYMIKAADAGCARAHYYLK